MFSRRAAECRGPTLGHQRKQPSASTTVVVHLVGSSRSPSDRSHEGIARCLRNRFARHHIVFRESFLVAIASHWFVGSIGTTSSSHCSPSTVGSRCRPRLRARSSVHGRSVHHVRGRAAPRRLVLRVLRTRVYIRERVCASLGRVRTCM
jgi:hypothetical protein